MKNNVIMTILTLLSFTRSSIWCIKRKYIRVAQLVVTAVGVLQNLNEKKANDDVTGEKKHPNHQ
jgi:hypothetical protein